jgi:hypothetical protein
MNRIATRAGVKLGTLAALLSFASAVAAANDWTASAKLTYDHNEGRYGQPFSSRDSSTTLTIGLDTENYAFDVSLPYVVQTGPGRRIALAGQRAIVIIAPNVTSMGWGDTTLGLTRYLLNEETHGFDLDMGASYKIATAKESKGLGSGKDDFSLQASVSKSLGPAMFSFTGGYTVVGKPEGAGYRNSGFASADVSVKPTKPVTLGVNFSYGGSSAAGSESTREVTYYASYRWSKKIRLEVHYLEGHSPQSPDRGWGATFSTDF